MTVAISKLRHLDVLDASTSTQVGRVEGVVVDPQAHKVTALVLGRTEDSRVVVPWADVSGFGPDAVTLRDGSGRREPADDLERRAVAGLPVVAARVLTADGDDIGVVHEVLAAERGGRIEHVDLGDRQLAGTTIVGLGDHALVVTA